LERVGSRLPTDLLAEEDSMSLRPMLVLSLALFVVAERPWAQVTAVDGVVQNSSASTRTTVSGAAGVTRLGTLVLAQSATCQASWLPEFGPEPGVQDAGFITTFVTFDDGSGPALYVGGSFTTAGGVFANNVAKWDGVRWWALGTGVNSTVFALAVFDDGSGPALYAGGSFTTAGGAPANRIARWDGSSWSALGSGTNERIRSLAVFDDGGGPALFAGGHFSDAGGVSAKRVAKWDGSAWSALGSGLTGGVNGSFAVRALRAHDDGSGVALYAAGDFTDAGGVSASCIARWNGSNWSALGSGANREVDALTVFDDGSGPELVAGGFFLSAGGVSASCVAKWDGTQWAPLGSGMDYRVHALTVFDDGSGSALYAGGTFSTAGGVPAENLAKWDGSSWSPLGDGTSPDVNALGSIDHGSGPVLYAGGTFDYASGVRLGGLARWDGSTLSATGGGLNHRVESLTVFDDGSGPALHAGGLFTTVGGTTKARVAKWDGSNWSSLGGVTFFPLFPPPTVMALRAFDDGDGSTLFVGGNFTHIDSLQVNRIAKWDGSGWSTLGSGVNSEVYALLPFDDGSGPALYVGGLFTAAGGQGRQRIARWNGSSWSGLGTGMGGASSNTAVHALTVFDDGSGPALIAGGEFTSAGGVAVQNVAKWNGAGWSPLGGGTDGPVHALAVFDDGSGPALFAGGNFVHAGGLPTSRIAKWNGSSWSALGSGVSAPLGTIVRTLSVFEDGSGPALVVGGDFTSAGGLAVGNIAKWDGSSWSAMGGGWNDTVMGMTIFYDGSERALHVGGIGTAVDSGDAHLAKWGCPDSTAPALSCPESVLVPDALSGSPGEVVTFSVTAEDDQDPSPGVVCVPPSGSFFPRGTTLVHCTATDGAGNSSTCEFLVTVQPKVRRP
jgi:HYR domain-containing protein